ncbi:zinc finger protein 135 [Electrophorus electricus]|nr:zinc finger protein 135 [Electrophorus electricus]XP_035387418.1 zinc finger protein 135 [Electrophorus electricus]XP_035387419.1 zinc finger protein 135 [Electrophorus electricus]XP_035387420.1 zinc finger protein 135 [Electrophorus electricus]XP_035387421.1 zinc finger protein 135 [Electrophorus electricus]XP_035387422.1 zinc finger protein 135 [Electrophorus electricus]
MEDTETELTSSEPDALGADFITVELDTQPIEYVVKWAEVGSKFTISCVKKESDENNCFVSDQLVKTEPEERFFAPYESVYPGCGDAETSLIASQEEEVKSDSDVEESMELGSSQLVGEEQEEEEGSEGDWEKGGSHSRDRPYCCHLCGKSYSHSSSLARHLHMHSAGDRVAPAPSPPKSSNKSGDGKKFLQCNLCGVRCNGKRLLAIHKKCHKTKRLHTCSTCGKTFNHSSSLSRHRLIHKAGLDKKLKVLYPTATPPATHAAPPRSRPAGRGKKKKKKPPQVSEGKLALGEKQYQCTQCDMVFGTSTSLSKHQVSHVRQLLNSYAQGKDALDKSSDLKIRLKLCSRDKPNCYTLCKKSKRGKGSKKRPAVAAGDGRRFGAGGPAGHEPSHGGERRYACNVCKKAFVRLSNLKQHQQTHASGKLYECQHCGKTFVHSSSFSRHKKVHAGPKADPRQRKRGRVIDESAPLESESE